MVQIDHANDDKTMAVPVTSLIPLKEAGFLLPEHATRELDPIHIFNLSETDASQWPSIEIVEVEAGLAVIDGNHRWKALERQAAVAALDLSEATQKEQDKALNNLTPEQQQLVTAAIEELMIPAHFGVYKDDKAVAKAALTANLKHGLPPKSKALVFIAMELYDVTRGEQPEPSQADIARLVGISRATLNEYLKKREKAMEKANIAEVTEGEGAGEGAAIDEEAQAREKMLKRADKFLKDLEAIYHDDTDTYNEVIKKFFPVVFVATHDMNADNDDTTYGDNIRSMLQVAQDVDASEVLYIKKFASALNTWIKSSAAKAKRLASKKTTAAPKTTTGD